MGTPVGIPHTRQPYRMKHFLKSYPTGFGWQNVSIYYLTDFFNKFKLFNTFISFIDFYFKHAHGQLVEIISIGVDTPIENLTVMSVSALPALPPPPPLDIPPTTIIIDINFIIFYFLFYIYILFLFYYFIFLFLIIFLFFSIFISLIFFKIKLINFWACLCKPL